MECQAALETGQYFCASNDNRCIARAVVGARAQVPHSLVFLKTTSGSGAEDGDGPWANRSHLPPGGHLSKEGPLPSLLLAPSTS